MSFLKCLVQVEKKIFLEFGEINYPFVAKKNIVSFPPCECEWFSFLYKSPVPC